MYSFGACLLYLAIEHAYLRRRRTVPTPSRQLRRLGAQRVSSVHYTKIYKQFSEEGVPTTGTKELFMVHSCGLLTAVDTTITSYTAGNTASYIAGDTTSYTAGDTTS